MEVCGGQTHSLIRNAIDQILPAEIEMIHGPGCPVCVTPLSIIDNAIEIASRPNVIFCTFGDMLRVPGSNADLIRVKAAGGDVRIIYSPLDALKLAKHQPDHEVVFLAIGFETTAPANAMTIKLAKAEGLTNFSALVSHVLVPPAIEAMMRSPDNRVQGFLAAGHVCSVMGYHQYLPLSETYKVPIVVTGFEPLDLLDGIRRAVEQLENGQAFVDNAYRRVVEENGNLIAQATINQVFRVIDRDWRGMGIIPRSGWALRDEYQDYDAEKKFDTTNQVSTEPAKCRAGDVLRGTIKPNECAEFGQNCTPRTPLGATMVSSEGACAAYYNYGRFVPISELAPR